MLAHLELLTIEAISYLWVSVRAFHKFIANMLSSVIWIGKILSLFRIRLPLFSTIHTRLHHLLPRLVDLFVISKVLMLRVLWHVSLETPIRYYRCGQQLYQSHSSYWKVWWYAPLLGSPPHGYVSVRPYVWLEMPQLSTTDMLWRMWSHCSNNRSAGGFRPTPISVLDWSQREKSSLSTTPKPTCLFFKENHNVLVCRKSHWNQLCASASWLAR